MLQMSIDTCTKSILRGFNEVSTASAMSVHINAAWDDIASLDINDFSSHNMQVDVRDGSDFVAVRHYGAAIKPSFRC